MQVEKFCVAERFLTFLADQPAVMAVSQLCPYAAAQHLFGQNFA